MRSPHIISPSLPAITATGFGTTIAQIMVLRELLVLFYGNEITAGVIFACWLLWSALGSGITGWYASRRAPKGTTLALLLTVLGAMLPLLVLLIRTSGIVFAVPAGELPGIYKTVVISFVVTGLFCPVSGALFGMCWAYQRQRNPGSRTGQPLAVYLGEALGAAIGGLVFYFVLFPAVETFTLAFITAGIILCFAGWIHYPMRLEPEGRTSRIIWILAVLLFIMGAVSSPGLNKKTRQFQWGKDYIASLDTPYHNIAIVKKEEQLSVFTNGLWRFSVPDRLSAEHAVHYPLLQHPHPRSVLLLGGGIGGHIEEIFKHPEIERADYVEPDPGLVPFIENYLPPVAQGFLYNERVNHINEDATKFLRHTGRRYDVIMMNLGDPINAEMNRFYTVEFFRQVQRHLRIGGVFSFAVSGGKEMMGPVQTRFLGSVRKTLEQVFPKVLVFPGEHIRFFAADKSGTFVSDVLNLKERIDDRNIELSYIREDTLWESLNPMRLDYLEALLSKFQQVAVNRDFVPICYFHSLMRWAYQWHPGFEKIFSTLAGIHPLKIWLSFAVLSVLIPAIFWTGALRFKTAVAGSVAVSGGVEMGLQMVLLLSFQVLEGFVYLQLALIIAFFMAGIGLGAAYVLWLQQRRPSADFAIPYFMRVQALFCLFPLLLIFLLHSIHGGFRDLPASTSVGWIFTGLSFTAGLMGGSHFSLAILSWSLYGASSEKTGGILYALDLVGAAGGVFFLSLFVLPVYGLISTLLLMSTVSFICFLTILRRN